MKRILISGLINTETTVKVKRFPIEYFPIDYPFFGVNTRVSGVAYNLAKAFRSLGDEVDLVTMTGNDFSAEYVNNKMEEIGVSTEHVKRTLKETPNSVVLYDEEGKRQIYCDLKDVQEATYQFDKQLYENADIVVACNTNFNRELLKKAKMAGKIIATDVHVLSDVHDEYNRDFMQYADLLFLSDENINTDYREFLMDIENNYQNEIIVLGMGAKGALMYVKDEQKFYELEAVSNLKVVNTVGAGDTLFSSFLHYYAKGISPLECLKKAQLFAAYKIGFDGASNGFASEEIMEQLEKDNSFR